MARMTSLAGDLVVAGTREVAPVEERAGSGLDERRPKGLRGLLRGLLRSKRAAPVDLQSAAETLSLESLKTELRVTEQEIADSLAHLAGLESGEREALARRDKLALDVAWEGREAECARLEQLEERRKVIQAALEGRFQPRVSAWAERARETVRQWRDEDRTQVEAIVEHCRAAERLAWLVMTRGKRRSEEQAGLLGELENLLRQAEPIPLARPDVDWTTERIVVRDVLTRVESVKEIVQRIDLDVDG